MSAATPSSVASGGNRAARRAAVTLLLVAATVLGSLLVGALPASAHAVVTSSEPMQGAVLRSAPREVTLTFSEGVALSGDSIRVFGPRGHRADIGEIRDLGNGRAVKYGVGLHPGLPEGTFTVAWKAVSADSHPVSGAFTFSIGTPSKTSGVPTAQETDGGLVGVLYGAARYTSYAGFILLVGGGAFVLACRPAGARTQPLRRLVTGGGALLAASTLALLLLRTPYTGSGRLADAFDPGGLWAAVETKTGAALVSRLLLLAAAAPFVAVLFGAYARRENAGERKDLACGLAVGGTVVAVGIATTWALAEHASTGIQPGVAMPLDVLHLLAVAAWLGGLTALLVSLYRDPFVERAAARRFSRVAFGSVIVLAGTGVYQAWRQVGSWDALTSTSYGRLLLVKIGLVAVAVGLGWISRRWTARLQDSARPGAQGTRVPEEVERVTAGKAAPAAGSGGAETATGKAASETQEAQAPREGDNAEAEVPGEVTSREQTAVSADPRRAAQLARQQAARATARRKRLRDADRERSELRRTVLAEASVAVVLLGVTTVLTGTQPARTEEAARAAPGAAAPAPARPVTVRIPFDTGGRNGKGTARLELDQAGNALHIWLTRPDGSPLDADEVKVSFTLPAKNLGPLPVAPPHIRAGHWSASGVQLPMPGDWKISVTVRTSDIDQVTETRNVKIG
jgi:copper transport protein